MSDSLRTRRYSLIAIFFHWIIAVAVMAQISIGLAMTKLDWAPMRLFQLYQLHKSVGITVLLLSVLRLAWRMFHRPPSFVRTIRRIESVAASVTHAALYTLIIALPVTGWAVVSLSRYNIPTVLYGIVPWPHLQILTTLHDKPTAEAIFKHVHAWGAWVLIALLVLHVGAALRHHHTFRDDTLWRMMPLMPRPTSRGIEEEK